MDTPSVVLAYCDILSQSQSDIAHLFYFDNLFTTINLLAELEKRCVKGSGRILYNPLGICSLLKKTIYSNERSGCITNERFLPIILLHAVRMIAVQ